MKILQINTEATMASPGRIACDLGRVFEEQGHDVVIAYGRGNPPKDLKSIKIGSDLDVKIHALKTRIFDNVGFNSKKATIDFIEKVKEYDPDVIHLHNLHGYYINIEILFNYLKEANKKVIWTLHDCWSFTGHCSHFDYVKCFKWKEGCFECQQKTEYPASKYFDRSKQNYLDKKKLFTAIKDMTIVTPSKWLGILVKESFLGKYPVEVINNGIDLNIFKPTESNFREKYNLGSKKIILGVASVWTEKKGYKYFIELAKELEDNYQIIMVGLTEKQKKQLPQNIIGITRTDNLEELVKIYTAANIFFNPTLEDTFPTVNLESLACGTPVYTFDVGGSIESIDEKSGAIIKKVNKESFVGIEKFLMEDCIKRIKAFNKEKKFKEYLDVLLNR